MFTKFKQKLFPNRATALLLETLDSCDTYFDGELMWPVIRRFIEPALYQSSPKRDAQVRDDVRAAIFIMIAVAAYAEEEVTSGRYHIYRGSLTYQGQSLRRIAERSFESLNDNGFHDDEEYRDRLERLAQDIEEAG